MLKQHQRNTARELGSRSGSTAGSEVLDADVDPATLPDILSAIEAGEEDSLWFGPRLPVEEFDGGMDIVGSVVTTCGADPDLADQVMGEYEHAYREAYWEAVAADAVRRQGS